ncbi:MAG TPA: DedA family protein [Gaiellaceae bacterium]|nr:DedA family protein [Gaiellaceae bacterium]
MHEITDAATSFVGDYGLYAVFALMFVDALLPAASEVVMVYAGAVAVGAFPGSKVTLFGWEIESTAWAYVAIALAGTIGYTLGSIAGWTIGRYGGRPYLERHGRWLHITPEKLDRADAWFERYGDVTVFFSRMLPVVRSFVSIPAGIGEMPLGRYTVFTFAGSIPWCFGLAAIGVAAGSQWERFHEDFRFADYAVVALVLAGVAAVVFRTYRRRQRRRAVDRSAETIGR